MRISILIFLCLSLFACELIVIGEKIETKPVYDLTQDTPIGVALLFKYELDSSNHPAAAQLIAGSNGKRYLAIDKYNYYYDLSRLSRVIKSRQITSFNLDTLTENRIKVELIFDFYKKFELVTENIDDKWFIISYPPNPINF